MKADSAAINKLIEQLLAGASSGDIGSPPLPPPLSVGKPEDMAPWQSSVESRLGQLHGDIAGLSGKVDSNFRWLLGAYGAGVALILGALAGGLIYLADKLS